ncbi:dihydroorotate dehydrogenase [Nitrospira defluvii]|nr:dihydroorotate dehydrogenase [Nitrospira defluvii]
MNTSPTYRIDLSYEDNYKRGPFFSQKIPRRTIVKRHLLLGFEVNSRIGVPAGPLLNSNWIKTYAALGFDLPVYKTVRTCFMPSHPSPNCLILDLKEAIQEKEIGGRLTTAPNFGQDWTGEISITNSFGMPSRDPKEWQEDVAKAKNYLDHGQILIVSVVGTPGQGNDLAEDYALGASMAVDAGADIVEINLSCPNVISGEGILFTDPGASSRVSSIVKKKIGATPLLIKMGYIPNPALLEKVVTANASHVEGIASVNTLPFEVVQADGSPALQGKGRLRSGVCGAAIKSCAMTQARRLVDLKNKKHFDFIIVGVGGAMTTHDIRAYFDLGVDAVMSATGAMWDPYLAYKYWEEEKGNA